MYSVHCVLFILTMTTPATTAPSVTTCFDLTPSSNAKISYKDGSTDNRPEGTVAIYSCDIIYTLNGGSTRTCQSDGTWSGSAPTSESESFPQAQF